MSYIPSVKDVSDHASPFNLTTWVGVFSMVLKDSKVDESCIKQFGVLSGVEGCCLLGTLIGPIETVFWAAIFVLAKTVHLFIPRSFTVATSICGFVHCQFESSLLFTVFSVIGLVSNFFTSSENEFKSFPECIMAPLENSLSPELINYQFFD